MLRDIHEAVLLPVVRSIFFIISGFGERCGTITRPSLSDIFVLFNRSLMLSKDLFGSLGVGVKRCGRATAASKVSYGKNEALGRPNNS